MKNNATNRLEDWLDEDEVIHQKSEFKKEVNYDNKEELRTYKNKKEDDPWI